jgi:uncharacterized protein
MAHPLPVKIAYFRFYEELNDFLSLQQRKKTFPWLFQGHPSVKFAIETIGVPHVEVDLILANSVPVDFSYKMVDGDRISVYPVFESIDIALVSHLREKPLRDLKFILDVHLGKLTKFMRLFGFDSYYQNNLHDHEIINLAETGGRVILTRDRNLLKNKRVTHGYWVRSQRPDEQINEVLCRFDLENNIRPFTRCLECNNLVMEVSKESIFLKLKPQTLQDYQEFWKCVNCGRVY